MMLFLQVFQDTSWMSEAVNMDIDSAVYVLKMPGLPDRVPAKIRYKGPLKNKSGLMFGVELSAVSFPFLISHPSKVKLHGYCNKCHCKPYIPIQDRV